MSKRAHTEGLVKAPQGREIARVAMVDSTNKQLSKLEAGMLACVETVDWAQVAKGAGSLEILARRHGLGQGIEDHAFAIKTEAERGLGVAMAASEKAPGIRGVAGPGRGKRGIVKTRVSSVPSYVEQGIGKALANKARRMAALTWAEVNAVVSRDKTLAQVTREKTATVRVKRLSLPDAKYRVIYADPPWTYRDKADGGGVQRGGPGGGGVARQYPTMTIEELCELDVQGICDQDCVLFLWVTSPLLFECQPVITAWGFTCRASIVWNKDAYNQGHYVAALQFSASRSRIRPLTVGLGDSAPETRTSASYRHLGRSPDPVVPVPPTRWLTDSIYLHELEAHAASRSSELIGPSANISRAAQLRVFRLQGSSARWPTRLRECLRVVSHGQPPGRLRGAGAGGPELPEQLGRS